MVQINKSKKRNQEINSKYWFGGNSGLRKKKLRNPQHDVLIFPFIDVAKEMRVKKALI